ncbi:DUF6113 family protein [Nocardioidaceae bacterium SCSIO 66511]|nr:DUF6113 family protein [Nocardioidaceae bacterium SCSIO 66511]
MPARQLLVRAAFGVAGAVVCLAALIAHRHVWSPFGVELPWGLALSLTASYLVVRAAALLDDRPIGAICAAVGWAVMFMYLFSGRPEGDYLFASDWIGYTMLIGGLVVVGAAVVVSMTGPRPTSGKTAPTI